jgi:signal transduction histidine kinase
MFRRWWLDVAIAVVLTAGAQVELWSASLRHPVGASLTTAALTVGLVARRRWPTVVGVIALAVLCLHQAVLGDVEHASAVAVLAIVVALFSLGAYAEPRRALTVGLTGAAAFSLVVALKGKPLGDAVFVGIVLFVPWLLGLELHRRGARVIELEARANDLGQLAEQRARAAVEEERGRIARELHDVVAHAMSVIVVQAAAERRVLPRDQESTRAVLETIERTGRQALVEMRRLLGMMRSSDSDLALAPQPSLAYVRDLCDQVDAAGLPVDLEVVGEQVPLPPGVDVSAYRIVQEALTNALKHAGPARACVRISYDHAHVDLEVTDDGNGAGDTAEQAGHGLLGMQERVAVYGGELLAGNSTAGGYSVRVRLPLNGPPP